jgi:hypothetical protein
MRDHCSRNKERAMKTTSFRSIAMGSSWLALQTGAGLLRAEPESSAQGLGAVDLTKIDRRIAKEPVYETNKPKYCLLVS